jgi:hypothetical protein
MPRAPEVLTFDNFGSPYKSPLQEVIGQENKSAFGINRSERALKWWDSFSKGVIGISTFGASITFTVIVSSLPDPVEIRSQSKSKISKKTNFGREEVRKFLAIAWLMFVAALGFALVSQLLLRRSRGYGKALKTLEITLNGLILTAFMFLSLAVAAYVPEVGWAGVGFMSFFAIMVGSVWLGASDGM